MFAVSVSSVSIGRGHAGKIKQETSIFTVFIRGGRCGVSWSHTGKEMKVENMLFVFVS